MTVVSRNLVTVMSLVSRKRVEEVPRNLETARSLLRNLVTEMSFSSRNLVTVISFSSRNLATASSRNLVTVTSLEA